MQRIDGRAADALRAITIQMGFQENAGGSCLISFGKTQVLCAASIEPLVPPFLAGSGKGWVTAEYAMLPASTGVRKKRDGLRQDGRGVEIQRLIGRSLRASVDLAALGERTIRLDCDVLNADGGTRTAAITGAWCALKMAANGLVKKGEIAKDPVITQVAAVSCGLVEDKALLDLCYQEDSRAEVDMNVVMTAKNQLVEVQGSAEGRTFSLDELQQLLALSQKGIERIFQLQYQAWETL